MYKSAAYGYTPPVMEHACIPFAAVMVRLTFEPADTVMLAPFGAVAVTLLLVGPKAWKETGEYTGWPFT